MREGGFGPDTEQVKHSGRKITRSHSTGDWKTSGDITGTINLARPNAGTGHHKRKDTAPVISSAAGVEL